MTTIYVVDSAADVVIETAEQGNDAVIASAHYGLSATAEIELMRTLDQNGTAQINLGGNDFGQTLYGNNGDNVLNGLGGGDTIIGYSGNDQLYGGVGVDTLNGGSGEDRFVFFPGEANGDIVVDFVGNGDAAGDTLYFIGYDAGATFTQIDTTQWQVNYNGGASHDVITFLNGGAGGVHPSDVVFM
jgi:Ca2+-binding RTX toxin-like protein